MIAALAFRNVLRNKERSLLTLVGVVLAIGAYVAMVSLAAGFIQRVDRELQARDIHVYVTGSRGSVLPASPLSGSDGGGPPLPLALEASLREVKGVRLVLPVIRTTLDTEHLVVPVLALPLKDAVAVFKGARFDPGFNAAKDGAALTELYVGQRLLQDMQRAQKEGPPVIDEVPFKVAGTVTSAGFLDYMIIAPIESLLSARPDRGVNEFWIVVDDVGQLSRIKGELQSAVDAFLNKERTLGSYVGARRIRVLDRLEYAQAAHEYLGYGWLLQFAVSMVGVLIAVTASMNTMLMSTYERLGEYATLRAVGASRRVIATTILYEAIFLNVTGGLLGIIFGSLATGVLDRAVAILLEIPYPLAGITPMLLLQALGLSFMVGLVGAIIPIIVVNRIDLVAQLRKGM